MGEKENLAPFLWRSGVGRNPLGMSGMYLHIIVLDPSLKHFPFS